MEPTPYRALIVDDEAPIRALLVRALHNEGFRCDAAADGIEAEERLKRGDYDAVVLDLRMPKRHGHAVACELLKEQNRPLIAILTGVTEPRLAADLQARGVEYIGFKPLNFRSFARDLRSKVGDRRRELQRKTLHAPLPSADSPGPDLGACPQTRPVATPDRHGPGVVLFVETLALGEGLVAQLREAGIDAVTVRSSEELYDRVRHGRADMVVLEHELRGFLSGLEIAERLSREVDKPSIVLLARDPDELVSGAQGVACILPSGASHSALAAALKDRVTLLKVDELAIPPAARELVARHERLRPLPQLLVRLVSYLEIDSEEVSVPALVKDISTDSAATSRLLTLTNSASNGLRRKITHVGDAISLLGARRAICLILGSTMVSDQSDLLRDWSEPMRVWYHQRSVLMATTAAAFAQRFEHLSRDTAFTLGLLQDAGILVMAGAYGRKYAHVIARAHSLGHLQLHALELEDYGLTHAHVSAALLKHWKFPVSLVRLVLDHHSERHPGQNAAVDGYLRSMRIAEAWSNLADCPHPARRNLLNQQLGPHSQKGEACRSCLAEAVTKTAEACQLLSVPLPQSSALESLIEKLGTVDGLRESLSPTAYCAAQVT